MENSINSNEIYRFDGESDKIFNERIDFIKKVFKDTNNLKEIAYTSSYIPGRIILFDGSIPHAIRPQSVKAPKFRFTLSLFFE